MHRQPGPRLTDGNAMNDPNVTTLKCDRALVGKGLLAADLSALTFDHFEFV